MSINLYRRVRPFYSAGRRATGLGPRPILCCTSSFLVFSGAVGRARLAPSTCGVSRPAKQVPSVKLAYRIAFCLSRNDENRKEYLSTGY